MAKRVRLGTFIRIAIPLLIISVAVAWMSEASKTPLQHQDANIQKIVGTSALAKSEAASCVAVKGLTAKLPSQKQKFHSIQQAQTGSINVLTWNNKNDWFSQNQAMSLSDDIDRTLKFGFGQVLFSADSKLGSDWISWHWSRFQKEYRRGMAKYCPQVAMRITEIQALQPSYNKAASDLMSRITDAKKVSATPSSDVDSGQSPRKSVGYRLPDGVAATDFNLRLNFETGSNVWATNDHPTWSNGTSSFPADMNYVTVIDGQIGTEPTEFCRVWFFASEAKAKAYIAAGYFSFSNWPMWTGTDRWSGYGVILDARTSSVKCARVAAKVFGLKL